VDVGFELVVETLRIGQEVVEVGSDGCFEAFRPRVQATWQSSDQQLSASRGRGVKFRVGPPTQVLTCEYAAGTLLATGVAASSRKAVV
jgi:hypothetical protein